jgi:predicted nucleotidyltransferase
MRRDEALRIIAEHRAELTALKVKHLYLFGSVARDEARPDSDVDVPVEFSEPVGLFDYARLNGYLEELLGRSVDLATPDALRRQFRDTVIQEAVSAA